MPSVAELLAALPEDRVDVESDTMPDSLRQLHERFSTRRVLTMDYIAGRVTSEFLSTNPSQELRNQFAERIYRAGTRMFARRRMYYSDVHPGNYIFCDDGQLGLIDFGGVRVLNDHEWEYMRLANEAMRGTREDLLGHYVKGLT